ncbi:MAG: hypothetical protein H6694_07330 [Candidatus Latescibacteria bacterium]|nr:hypothetical protein [Candidatus Latescibacterota bacterium]
MRARLSLLLLGLALAPAAARAEARADDGAPQRVEYLVPTMAEGRMQLAPGERPYRHHLGFSTAAGSLGAHRQYALRLAYCPRRWLGYEASVAHNPASAVHALFHDFSVVLRRPLPWRLQPYVSAGYGMMIAFPGGALLADSITRNAFSAGGGLELFLRDDVALRLEARGRRVLDRQDGETLYYDYADYSAGFVFYRSLTP